VLQDSAVRLVVHVSQSPGPPWSGNLACSGSLAWIGTITKLDEINKAFNDYRLHMANYYTVLCIIYAALNQERKAKHIAISITKGYML